MNSHHQPSVSLVVASLHRPCPSAVQLHVAQSGHETMRGGARDSVPADQTMPFASLRNIALTPTQSHRPCACCAIHSPPRSSSCEAIEHLRRATLGELLERLQAHHQMNSAMRTTESHHRQSCRARTCIEKRSRCSIQREVIQRPPGNMRRRRRRRRGTRQRGRRRGEREQHRSQCKLTAERRGAQQL